jgi:hypothetical protein
MLQELLTGLRECRNVSIREADEKEAVLDAQRKNNYNLKQKLHNITAEKVHILLNKSSFKKCISVSHF